MFQIGKKSQNISANKSLMRLGDKVESKDKIIAKATDFIRFCYDMENGLSMTEKR